MQQRDEVIDILRGFVILQMIANHISPDGIFDQILHPFESIRATVGFVLFSGYVAGLVYHKRSNKGRELEAKKAFFRRAAKIYVIHIILVLGVVAGYWLVTGQQMAILENYGILKTLFLTLTLKWQHAKFMNILPMYIFFLAIAPALFPLIKNGKAKYLLMLSLALYFAGWIWPIETSFVDRRFSFDAFPFIQWQFIFFLGAAAGFHWQRFQRLLQEPAFKWPRRLGLIFLLVFFVLFDRPAALLGAAPLKAYLASWLDQFPLGPLLLFASILFNVYAYLLVKKYLLRHPSVLLQRSLAQIAFMGKNSLLLFVLHLIPAFLVQLPWVHHTSPIGHQIYFILVLGILTWSAHQKWVQRLLPS